VYVQPFPFTGAKWAISRNGGVRPRWRRDGKEIFYVTAESRLAAAPIVAGEALQVGESSELFDVTFVPAGANPYPYAVSADGQRFLVITPEETAAANAITVILNWDGALRNQLFSVPRCLGGAVISAVSSGSTLLERNRVWSDDTADPRSA
jgi:hypothetical protein